MGEWGRDISALDEPIWFMPHCRPLGDFPVFHLWRIGQPRTYCGAAFTAGMTGLIHQGKEHPPNYCVDCLGIRYLDVTAIDSLIAASVKP
jgi:hypothetical protein